MEQQKLEQAIKKLPSDIQTIISNAWQSYNNAVKQHYTEIPNHRDFIPSMCRVWAGSEFVINQCIQAPNVILELFETGDILLEYPKGEYYKKLAVLIKICNNIEQLQQILREFRRREMLRIAWRDLAKWTTPVKSLTDLTELANTIVSLTNEKLFHWQSEKMGIPIDPETNSAMPMLIIAMGKLGASELNFSSDIDLIYCYPKEGEFANGDSYFTFYLRLARSLTTCLNQVTKDGFVFRVDLRLRPYGTSGALVCSIPALIEYYKTHGREWERYALIKARVINADNNYSPMLENAIKKFVYRSYIDFSAIDSLRILQNKINQEIERHGLDNNIKRGPGGIREIEFITQTYKIIRGGRQYRLQNRNTLKSLILLREIRSISQEECTQLSNAYLFLRNVENKLQIYNDKQTHDLTDSTLQQQRLAYAMSYLHWNNFITSLNKHRHYVQQWFDKLISRPQWATLNKADKENELQFSKFWKNIRNQPEHESFFTKLGFKHPEEVVSLLCTLNEFSRAQKLNKTTRNHLNNLLPRILILIASKPKSDRIFKRVLPLIEAIIKNNVYILLLGENPFVLAQIVNLCAASPWIADELARYPLLLDELLDPSTLYAPHSLKKLKALLNKHLKPIIDTELSQKIQAVCWFKQTQVLRVAAADITGTLPLMRVSDCLTDIATVVVDKVRELILEDMVMQYGAPTLARNYRQHGFCIVAYGKLGGIELNYSSDLDLVFLHPKIDLHAQTDGNAPISNQEFYTRLGQGIVKAMNQKYTCGALYKIDLRLRPSGSSGLIVSSADTFANYQHKQAWDWEHQALVRSRRLCGSSAIGKQFAIIRQKILAQPRDSEQLKRNIVSMREKMRDTLEKHGDKQYDVKQGIGGLVDIEFIAQYSVLQWSHQFPSLLEFTDNVRIFERVGMEGLLPMKQTHLLTDAYKIYRVHLHKTALHKQSDLVGNDKFIFYRLAITKIWQQIFNPQMANSC